MQTACSPRLALLMDFVIEGPIWTIPAGPCSGKRFLALPTLLNTEGAVVITTSESCPTVTFCVLAFCTGLLKELGATYTLSTPETGV